MKSFQRLCLRQSYIHGLNTIDEMVTNVKTTCMGPDCEHLVFDSAHLHCYGAIRIFVLQ